MNIRNTEYEHSINKTKENLFNIYNDKSNSVSDKEYLSNKISNKNK